MKRLISLFICLCMILTIAPCALAVKTVYINKMTFDAFESYTTKTEAYTLPNSASAYGSGVTLDGKEQKNLWFVKEADGNIALTSATDTTKQCIIKAGQEVTGKVVAKLKVKPIENYTSIMLHIQNNSGYAAAAVKFDPQSSNTETKVSYSDGDNTHTTSPDRETPVSITRTGMLLPLNEWTEVVFNLNTATQKYSVTVGGTEIITDTAFRGNATSTLIPTSVSRIVFYVNKGKMRSNVLFDDFELYMQDDISSINSDKIESGTSGTTYVFEKEVSKNGSFTLPTTVSATLVSGADYDAPVVWESKTPDLTAEGTQTFNGTVTDDAKTFNMRLDLTVTPPTVESAENPTIYLGRNTDEKMPEKLRVKYSDGNYGFEAVTWEKTPDLTKDSEQIDGTVGGKAVTATVYAYGTNTPVRDVDLQRYNEGDILRNSPWTLKTAVEVVATEFPADSGNMAMRYTETVDKSTNAVSYGYACLKTDDEVEGTAVVSADLYLPKNNKSFVMEILDIGYASEIIEFYFNENGTVKVAKQLDSEPEMFPTEEWFNIKCIADQYKKTYDLFINNVLIAKNMTYKGEGPLGIVRFGNQEKNLTSFTAYADNIRVYALSDMLEGAYNDITLTDEDVTENITLPVPADNDVTVKWSVTPDDGTLSSTGAVSRPVWGSGDKAVTLTAALEKKIGALTITKNKALALNVKEADPTDEQAVDATLEKITFDVIKGSNTSESYITADLDFNAAAGKHGATVAFGATPAGLIDNEGKVYPPESADTPVTLTVQATRGSVTKTKTFNLTVKYSATLSDMQAVRKAMAAVSLPSATSGDLTLPTSSGDVTITWKSNNLSALSDSGAYNYPSSAATVTMTGIFTKGDARDEKTYTVAVSAYSNGGGGGGGGGSSKNNGKGSAGTLAPSAAPVTENAESIAPLYTDMDGYSWADDAVRALTNDGVLQGSGDKKFEPARNVSREEFVAMAVRAFGIESTGEEIPFTDVSEDDWHRATTSAAYGFGLISGIDEHTFGSGMSIKRGDMFVIMYNAAKKCSITLEKVRDYTEFADSGDIPEYALDAVRTLYEAGIVNGYGDTVNCGGNATRAEAAKMIYALRQLVKGENR